MDSSPQPRWMRPRDSGRYLSVPSARSSKPRVNRSSNGGQPVHAGGAKARGVTSLDYSIDTEPGITRESTDQGFAYRGVRGRVIRDRRTLARIRRLAIPPAWQDVWICANPNGHLQATGKDARGRKQYRYHPVW